MLAGLGAPMAKGGVRLEPMAEGHRAALKAACAEDPEIWPIYATSWVWLKCTRFSLKYSSHASRVPEPGSRSNSV